MNYLNSRRLYGVALAMIVFSGCSETAKPELIHKVSDIRADSSAWQGKTVRLKGKVSGLFSLPMMDTAYYELDDGSGTIMIQTSKGLPAKGEKILMSGTVINMIAIGNLTGGLTVKEEGRW